MDRQLSAYLLIGLMIALALSIATYELISSNRRAERRRKELQTAEYERIMAKREQ